MYHPIHLLQGTRYFLSSIAQKITGPTKYEGNAEQIAKQIINSCWNEKYYQTSTHHYQEFWTRDFGYTTESLIKLGNMNKVRKTLAYALQKFSKTGIKTTITREGIPFSFPNVYSPDSVALLFHALRLAKDEELIEQHETFLQQEIDSFTHITLEDGRIRTNTQYSGMRDYAERNSSCYDHCMAILLAREAKKLGFRFQYTEKELVKKLQEYWTGEHYRDDRTTKTPTGDANTIPYWLGVGKNFNKTFKTIQQLKLDTPIPLTYTNAEQKMIMIEMFVKGWEQNTHWPFIGLIWAHAVKKYNPTQAKQYKQEYTKLIEKYGTLYEVYTTNGKPYKSPFYHADEGMIWAANYLTL